MVEMLKAVILGIIQGLTEFLPVSSSGHLLIARKLFGLAEAGLLLDTLLHVGTLAAVIIVFRKDIWAMIRRPFSHLTLLVIVGTVPTAIIGLLFKDFFEEIAQSGVTAGWEFLATGLILWLADSNKKRGYKKIESITFADASIVGALQGAAILPAISRSGLTIAGALFRRIDKDAAARFSFLLSIPAILGGAVVQIPDLLEGQAGMIGTGPLIAGTLAAAVAGYFAVRWMINIIKRGSLIIFAVYVWIIGIAVIISQAAGIF